ETPLGAERGTLLPLGALPDGAWLGRLYGATQPDELLRFELPSDDRTPHAGGSPLARPFSDSVLRPTDLAAPEDFRWRSGDGREIQGWLYRPASPAVGLVVQVHGGPTAHSEDALSAFIQTCVAAGFP